MDHISSVWMMNRRKWSKKTLLRSYSSGHLSFNFHDSGHMRNRTFKPDTV